MDVLMGDLRYSVGVKIYMHFLIVRFSRKIIWLVVYKISL